MTINVEAGNAPTHVSEAGTRQVLGQARQGRWMSELERAMFQHLAKQPVQAQSGRRAGTAAAPVSVGENHAQPHTAPAGAESDHADQGGAAGTSAPVAAPLEDDQRELEMLRRESGMPEVPAPLEVQALIEVQATIRSSQPSASTGQALAIATESAANVEADVQVPGKHEALPPAGAAQHRGQLPPTPAPVASVVQVSLLEGQPVVNQAIGVIPPSSIAGARIRTGAEASPVNLARAAAAGSVQFGIGNTHAMAEELPAADAPEHGGAPAPQEHEGEAFAERLLHVYRNSEGVHAWVRDAALRSEQAALVLASMSRELAGGGQRLVSLTINGKPVFASTLEADALPHTPADDAMPPAPLRNANVRGQ